jgi:hypothetical protein
MHLYADMQTRIIIENKLDEVYQSILRENDRVKNNALPDAKVDANSVDFGDARFMLPITRQVTIENVGLVRALARKQNPCWVVSFFTSTNTQLTGLSCGSRYTADVCPLGSVYSPSKCRKCGLPTQLPLRWRFVPKLDEPDVHRPWLEVSPMSGSLMPGMMRNNWMR